MTTAVVVLDLLASRRSDVVLGPAHFAVIERVWPLEDSLFVEMQGNPFFAGRRRWCDLTPTHFRLMVAHNLTVASLLPDADRVDQAHPAVRSLHLLLTALVVCLQRRTECLVDLLRVTRFATDEITYDFAASLGGSEAPPPIGGLRLVVDNG